MANALFLDRVGRRCAISPEQQEALRKHIAAHSGATLVELRDAIDCPAPWSRCSTRSGACG